MIPLTTRQLAILSELLAADGPMTTARVALRVGITPRMVRYDLRVVTLWLREKGTRLLNKPNFGVLVDASHELKSELQAQLAARAGVRIILSPDERANALTLSLLLSNEPLSAKQLARELAVAHPTALAGMQNVQRWLAAHGLQLVRRPHVGFSVGGRETARRAAIVQFLIEAMGEGYYLPLCAGSQPSPRMPEPPAGPRLALPFLAGLDLEFARRLVDSMESHLSRQFTDSSRISLLLAMAVLMYRAQQGRPADVDPEQLAAVRPHREFLVASAATLALEQRLGIALPEEETAYVAMELLGAWTRRTLAEMVAEGETVELGPEALRVVKRLLAEVSCYLLPCLEVDSLLVRNLSVHVGTLLYRLRFGLPMRNPLLDDVRRTYPYVFQVAQRARAILQDAAGVAISEHEIAGVAMHLAAALERLRTLPDIRKKVLIVCGEGTAMAWLLVSRVQVELPQLTVVEVTSAAGCSPQHARAQGVAAIIATVAVEGPSVPVIVVSPLLPPEDVAAIRAALRLDSLPLELRAQQREPGYSLADLLSSETIALRVNAQTWQEVVRHAGQLLVAHGAAEPRYVPAMQAMIEQHGPYVVILPGVALLHAYPSDGVKRTCMSLVTLGEPVRFGHARNDPVQVAVALATMDNYAHYAALRQLLELVRSPEGLADIMRATKKQAVCALIARISRNSGKGTPRAPDASPSQS